MTKWNDELLDLERENAIVAAKTYNEMLTEKIDVGANKLKAAYEALQIYHKTLGSETHREALNFAIARYADDRRALKIT